MPIVSHVILGIDYPAAVPDWLVTLWEANLKDRAELMFAHIRQVISDSDRFKDVIADPANQAWMALVDDEFISKRGLDREELIAHHAANLSRSYDKWLTKLTHLYETVEGVPAKRFKELVAANREGFLKGVAERTLPFTGTGVNGRGPAPLATLWLTGNPTVVGMLRHSDRVLEGGPYLVAPKRKRSGLKAMLNQRLIQAGITIIKSNFDLGVIARQNQLTDEQVQGFVDPALDLIPFTAGGDSHVDYILGENKQLYLEIKVSKM